MTWDPRRVRIGQGTPFQSQWISQMKPLICTTTHTLCNQLSLSKPAFLYVSILSKELLSLVWPVVDVYCLVVASGCQKSPAGSLPGEEDSPGTVGVLYGENSLIGSHCSSISPQHSADADSENGQENTINVYSIMFFLIMVAIYAIHLYYNHHD